MRPHRWRWQRDAPGVAGAVGASPRVVNEAVDHTLLTQLSLNHPVQLFVGVKHGISTASETTRRERVVLSVSIGTAATGWGAARRTRLLGPHESAHELAVHQGRNRIHVDATAGKLFTRVLNAVNSRWFHGDSFKPRTSELRQVGVLLQRSRHAPDPQLHAAPNDGGNLPAHHDVGDREPSAGLEYAEGFLQHAVLVR